MPELQNQKHEIFAQQLARGKSASYAFKVAGFTPNRGNASRLKAHESIQRRLVEIKESTKAAVDSNSRDAEMK